MGAAAISRLRSQPDTSAANPEEVLNLYKNRALKVTKMPASGPDPAVIAKLDQSAIGRAYYDNIDPERSILIHDCTLSVPSWCDAPAFSFQSMFRESAKIAKPQSLKPDELAADWYRKMCRQDIMISRAVLPFPTLGDAPFQLLAIANRMDLARMGNTRSGAEMHFVYGLKPIPHATVAPDVFVILEFRLPDFTPTDFRELARTWATLKTSAGPNYVTDLARALGQAGFSADPNGTAPTRLLRVSSRFNHSVTGPTWNLSQLTLDPGSADASVQSQFAEANLEDQLLPNAIQLPSYPALFAATPSLAAENTLFLPIGAELQAFSAITYTANDVVRPPDGVCDAEANRSVLALQQCTFCHTTETGTDFRHITNRMPGAPSRLSTFLAGTGTTAKPKLSDLYYGTGPVRKVTLNYKEFHHAADGNCTIADPKPVVRRFHDIARRTLFLAAILTEPLPNGPFKVISTASRFGTTMKD